MANKTPPLVIPVVIDSTGVNKGISDINSRLRTGVRGGSAGGGSIPGVGAGSFGGGGSLAGSVLGGAVAGSIAAGIGDNKSSGMSPRLQALHNRAKDTIASRNDNFISSFFQRRAASNFDNAVKFDRLAGLIAPGMRAGGITTRAGATPLSRAYDENARRFQARGKMMGSIAERGAPMFRTLTSAGKAVDGGIGGMARSMGIARYGRLAGGLGIASAVVGGYSALKQGGRGTASELDSLVGSTDYGLLRSQQLRNIKPEGLSMFNSFKLGGLKAAGGGPSMFELQSDQMNKDVSGIIGGIMESLGGFYESMYSGKGVIPAVNIGRMLGSSVGIGSEGLGRELYASQIRKLAN